MPRRNRKVQDRLTALQPAESEAPITLFGIRAMYEASGGEELNCTINAYCRTRVFEFPGIDFQPEEDEPHHTIYKSHQVQASVVADLVHYFENSTSSNHYAISPSLRHLVGKTDQKIRSQQKGRIPVFLVVEEFGSLKPTEMLKGECNTWDEMMDRDGKREPRLKGGREGEQFITAWATADGAWPDLPNNQKVVNVILAGVRVCQETLEPIRKYVDSDCLVTDNGKFVAMMRPSMSARASVTTPMDKTEYRERISDITRGIAALEQDIGTPHIALLVNSMYIDERKDDAYERLHYLRLWQSLAETGSRHLGYQGNIRNDCVVVAGQHSLAELTEHRDDVAHWWTDNIDQNILADLQRTINRLLHNTYF